MVQCSIAPMTITTDPSAFKSTPQLPQKKRGGQGKEWGYHLRGMSHSDQWAGTMRDLVHIGLLAYQINGISPSFSNKFSFMLGVWINLVSINPGLCYVTFRWLEFFFETLVGTLWDTEEW